MTCQDIITIRMILIIGSVLLSDSIFQQKFLQPEKKFLVIVFVGFTQWKWAKIQAFIRCLYRKWRTLIWCITKPNLMIICGTWFYVVEILKRTRTPKDKEPPLTLVGTEKRLQYFCKSVSQCCINSRLQINK